MPWEYEQADKFKSTFPKYRKKHPDEVMQCIVNLDLYQSLLQKGCKPGSFAVGFVHVEGHGVIAIDQTGMDGSGRQTRLYVYVDMEQEVLTLLTIGDKTSQRGDIRDCFKYVKGLRKERKHE